MSRGGRDLDCKIYVGDLARDTNEKDIERAFSYYGRLRSVWVARNPAGFAFVEYEDPRDADDAVRGLDGTSINGVRVRVENSTGKVRPKPWLRGGGGGGGGRSGGRPGGGRRPFHPDDRCYECGESGHYAYDCPRYKSRGRRHSRSRSRSPRRRSYSRSRSRSRDRRRDRSRDRYGRDSRDRSSRDRDRSSKDRYAASRSRTRSRSRSARSVPRNDD